MSVDKQKAIRELITVLSKRGDRDTPLNNLEYLLMQELPYLRGMLDSDHDLSDRERDYLFKKNASLVPFLKRLELVESSEEEDMEPFWIVFRLDDTLYRFEGIYSSWDEVDYSEAVLQEVESVEKVKMITETVYEKTREDAVEITFS